MSSSIARTAVVAAAITLAGPLLLAGCAGSGAADTSPPHASSSRSAASRAPAQSPAAWNATDGTITLGTGAHRIDIWLDAMCPYCARFDIAQRSAVAGWADGGRATVVLHPMTFLDRASAGSAYSTRAATILTEAARTQPDAVLPILADLFDAQPAEHTTGLSDDRLGEIAKRHGVDASRALRQRPFDAIFARASTTAFEGADAITGTPTVRVDGTTVPIDVSSTDLRSDVDHRLRD